MADDVLVLVPGILGSVLQKNGKDVWQLSIAAIWRFIAGGRDLSALRLNEGSIDEETVDGVVATGLLEDAQIIPGFVRIDGYTRVADELRRRLSIPEERFLPFRYDWRRDNRGTAKRLGAFVEARLAELPKDAKCIIVCHSMGGLIARYWLEVLGGWRRCRALVTIATPHRGSLNAVDFLCNGLSSKLGPLKLFDLTETMRSFTSVYQLLPIYPCVDPGDGTMLRVTEAMALPNLDHDRARAAIGFHREIEAAVDANLADPAYRKAAPIVCPIVGTSQATRQSARIVEGAVQMLISHSGIDMDGDGTVPRVSATPIELSDEHREVFVAGRHSSLQNMSGVLDQVCGLIQGTAIDLAQFRKAGRGAPEARLALDLDEVFLADEPVVIRARPSREPVTLSATVRAASGGTIAQARLRRDGTGAHIVSLDPLPDGVYRVEVGGAGAASITEVFAVVGGSQRRRGAVRWSSSFITVPAHLPVSAARRALAKGPEYLIVERAPDLQYAFEREEIEELGDTSKDLGSALGLHEVEASIGKRGIARAEPEPAPRGRLPSSGRLIARDDKGIPIAVGAPGHPPPRRPPEADATRTMRGPPAPVRVGAPPATAQEEEVSRFPKLEASEARPASPIRITADLALEPTAPGQAPLALSAPSGWKSFDVEIVLDSEQIEFKDGGRGIIGVRNGQPSDPAVIDGTVKATVRPGQQIEIRASYFYRDRQCGSAALRVQVATGEAGAPVRAAETTGSVAVDRSAAGPDLTVEIIALGQGRFLWHLHVSQALRNDPALSLPPNLSGICELGGDPANFVSGALQKYEETPRGQHVRWMEGFGEQLYRTAPDCFQRTFTALRKAFPQTSLSIQFVSDDPHVPWELMFVPEERRSRQLAADHAVARWLGSYAGWLRNRLRRGAIAAVAPVYSGANALPYAQSEAMLLQSKFGAKLLTPAGRDQLFALLEEDPSAAAFKDLAVLHYAGHGEFAATNAQRSALLLENDARVEVPEVNRSAVVLGEDTRAVVFLNACQVGRTGAVLSTIGGWAEAFIARQFAAVIAPLWSVFDEDALAVVSAFYDMALEQKLTLAEALRRIRKQYGATSQTYQSYLLFGDVMARFAT